MDGWTDANYIFSALVSNRCIRMMAARGADDVFACFANFINSLVECNLISIRRLNEQFVKIFNESWQQVKIIFFSWFTAANIVGVINETVG